MAKVNLGRIGFELQGAYEAAYPYKKLDVVNYNGYTYVARKNNPSVLPNTTDWQVLGVTESTGTFELLLGEDMPSAVSLLVHDSSYVKIGKLIHVNMLLTFGNIQYGQEILLKGIPFPAASETNLQSNLAVAVLSDTEISSVYSGFVEAGEVSITGSYISI